MPQTKEFIIQMEDRPGTLGRCCQALAESGVNILAFQAYEREGQSLIRMVVDDPPSAKKALDAKRIYYTSAEVALAELPHRSGELSRIASRLGEAHININYAYCGTQPGSYLPLVIFGVSDVDEAALLLDRFAEEEISKVA